MWYVLKLGWYDHKVRLPCPGLAYGSGEEALAEAHTLNRDLCGRNGFVGITIRPYFPAHASELPLYGLEAPR